MRQTVATRRAQMMSIFGVNPPITTLQKMRKAILTKIRIVNMLAPPPHQTTALLEPPKVMMKMLTHIATRKETGSESVNDEFSYDKNNSVTFVNTFSR